MSLSLRHLEQILGALELGRPFALTRYGDGERAIMEGREISTRATNRHWAFRPSQGLGTTALTDDLNAAFDCDMPGYYVGISCPCCNRADHAYYAGRLGETRIRSRTTYANLFCNGNWRYLRARFQDVVSASGRPVVLISNWDRDYGRARNALPYNAVEAIPAGSAEYDRPVPNSAGSGSYVGGCTAWYCANRPEILQSFRAAALARRGAIFLVQFGPIADLMIHEMVLANPENTYLDMGHSLDSILYGETSRGFLTRTDARMCRDMDVDWDL